MGWGSVGKVLKSLGAIVRASSFTLSAVKSLILSRGETCFPIVSGMLSLGKGKIGDKIGIQ